MRPIESAIRNPYGRYQALEVNKVETTYRNAFNSLLSTQMSPDLVTFVWKTTTYKYLITLHQCMCAECSQTHNYVVLILHLFHSLAEEHKRELGTDVS